MKVLIQIPCFNEEATLPATLADLPREIEGADSVEILVIDDGSSDRTAEVAREHGAHHVVRHAGNRGLAAAFRTGVDACLRLGADVIVNTDADNQYVGADIPLLVRPILDGEADLVVGDRQTDQVVHFSWMKKRLQRLGSLVVRGASRTAVPDAVSGFRALSREAALRINILSSFSYTIEMLIQAGMKRMKVVSVPIGTNPATRESRLYTTVPMFIRRSVVTLLRSVAMYRPLQIFAVIGLSLLFLGALPIVRFLVFYFQGSGAGHVQSLVLGGALVVLGAMALLIGLVADLIAFNRKMLEILLEKVRRLELEQADRRRDEGDEPRA